MLRTFNCVYQASNATWYMYFTPQLSDKTVFIKRTVCRPTERQLRKFKKVLINAHRNNV